MANLIELAKTYIPLLDEVYKNASCTSDLDGAPELARQGANANELIVPMLSMDGLGNYGRNSGYVGGDVTMTNKTVSCNFDRGRMFQVDSMDNAETAGLAFGRLSAEFIRTKVVPELDAFRFACYAGKAGISSAEGTLSDGASVIAALRAANTAMDEEEVPMDQRHAPQFPITGDQYQDNDVSEFIRDVAEEQKIGVETDYVRVRLYQPIASKENTFYARKFRVSVEVSSITGAGGEIVSQEGNLNQVGDVVIGEFNTATKTFTEAGASA